MQLGRRICAILLAASAPAAPALAQIFSTDASTPGTPFSTGVRGQAIPSVTIDRGDFIVGMPNALAVSNGSSLRGVAGGLEADLYDWRTRNNSAREGTLNYLRYARDYNAELYITANIRGLVEPDPAGGKRFYDTSIPTLASLAGDWVRYTNHIVPTYRQGQTITDARDQAILNSLVWSSATPGDNFDKLLNTSEAAVPKVKYWEIGNEPRVGLSGSYSVNNSYTFLAPPRSPDATHKTDFTQRYAALSAAMLAEDPTIQVGPALQWLSAVTEQEIVRDLLKQQPGGSWLPVHFLSYHPYQKLGEQTTPAAQTAYLKSVYDDHLSKITGIRNVIASAGRDPLSIKLVASEHNVSDWSKNDLPQEMSMAHALGNTETVFSFARLGVDAAHYWVWPAHRWDGTKYPSYLAMEKLRDHMGDKLLSISASNTDDVHLYTTRDSTSGEIALWGLNFADATNYTRSTPISNVGGRGKITLYTLGALVGNTSLASSNFSSEYGGAQSVGWKTVDMTGTRLDNLQLTFNSATITLLTIEKWRQMSLPGDVNADGVVNTLDSAVITAGNGTNEKNWWQGDVTGDGLVNSADAAVVTANNNVAVGTKWIKEAGNWTTASNWQGTVPNGTGANAWLASSITAARQLTLSSQITLGTLTFDNANPYDLAGTGSLRLLSSGSNTSRLYFVQGNQKITVPLNAASSSIIDIASGASLSAGGFNISSSKTVTLAGAGTFNVSGTQAHSTGAVLTINAGTTNLSTNAGSAAAAPLAINVNASVNFASAQNLASLTINNNGRAKIIAPANSALKTNALTVNPGGTLDLTDDGAIVEYSSVSPIGAWNGSSYIGLTGAVAAGRIFSSQASGSSILTTIAIAEAKDILHLSGTQTATWFGQSVDATAVLLRETQAGDADMTGTIDGDDFAQIDAGFIGNFKGYYNGDFNYSGKVDADDYWLIDSTYVHAGSNFASGSGISSVPEPAATLIALAVGTCMRLRRPR